MHQPGNKAKQNKRRWMSFVIEGEFVIIHMLGCRFQTSAGFVKS
jgi:hypothetical protein